VTVSVKDPPEQGPAETVMWKTTWNGEQLTEKALVKPPKTDAPVL